MEWGAQVAACGEFIKSDPGASLEGQHADVGNVSMVFRECLDNTLKNYPPLVPLLYTYPYESIPSTPCVQLRARPIREQ